MLSSVVTALALAASFTNVAAGPLRHGSRGYKQDAYILEDYTGYHVRYLALNCQNQHDTAFFEDCCHPLLRWQKLSDRPAQCIPSASASSSAAVVEPTSPPVDEDPIPDYDDDCSDDEPTASTTPAPAPTTTPKSETYTPPASTPKPTSTKAQVTTSEKPSSTKQPEPTSTKEPKPTSTKQAEPTSSKPATKTSSAAPEPTKGSGGGGDITGGFATFYEQDGVAGACGDFHSDSDKVVALDSRRYGNIDGRSSHCGRTVVITNTKNGKSVTAIVADACPTCENENCLDLSHGAFFQIATEEEGMVPITWHFA
ncbi:unnamed protein product [Rhizoctonia solani]|uniref:RlpA-like protein double-psi beta-barrel domain-containing protein n=1 Tax=Rhizoctonia solani TaxID=456999 RepID=A0A8H3B6I1_9AGAM|nr:unnamed protein product [Rhizoctonia solani]